MRFFTVLALAGGVLAGKHHGSCTQGYYWDSGEGCMPLPPPDECYEGEYYDSVYGCIEGDPPRKPPRPDCPYESCKTALSIIEESEQEAAASDFCSSYLSVYPTGDLDRHDHH